MEKKRERGDNFTSEEKEIFMNIMKMSASTIEDKKTDTNTNKRKEGEWLKIQKQYQELTGKKRDISQLKGFWRRTKLLAKKSISNHKRAVRATGGGPKPPSPTEEVQAIMLMCPTDFVDEVNEFDCDGIVLGKQEATDLDKTFTIASATTKQDAIMDIEEDVTEGDNMILLEDIVINNANDSKNEILTKSIVLSGSSKENIMKNNEQAKAFKLKRPKADASHKNLLLETNLELKEKTFKLMEEEYALKIKYQKQELAHQELRHKLEIDILLQEKEKKALEINILKKQLL